MNGPTRYVQWINEHLGFNPRAAGNSNALSEHIVDDLRNVSPKTMRTLIDSGSLVPLKNASVSTKVAVRNIDLVLYEHRDLPVISVQLAVETQDRYDVARQSTMESLRRHNRLL